MYMYVVWGYSRKNTHTLDRWQTGNSPRMGGGGGGGGVGGGQGFDGLGSPGGRGYLNLKILPWGSFLTLTLIDVF